MNNIIRIKNNKELKEESAQKKYIEEINTIVNINQPKSNITLNKKGIILSIDYKFDKSKSYRESKLLDLLTFLCKKSLLNGDIRIVCHSQLMKKFLKHMDIAINNKKSSCMGFLCTKRIEESYTHNLSQLVDDENLWTLFLQHKSKNEINNNKSFNISISRHGYTYANVVKGTTAQQYEKDAKLTIYGILTSLIHGNELVDNEKKEGLVSVPNLIYVSVLIRTWMTAICLYLPQYNKENLLSNTEPIFSLVVSPFIKETGKGYPGLDNEPDEIPLQINNIIRFLEYLKSISEVEFSNTIINENLVSINNFFNKNGKINIYTISDNYSIYLENNTFKSTIIENSNEYFNSKNVDNCEKESLTKLKIFHGKNKPSKNSKDLFTRWCEPFSRKNVSSSSGNTCSSRMNKI
jgi:hypothetical protein